VWRRSTGGGVLRIERGAEGTQASGCPIGRSDLACAATQHCSPGAYCAQILFLLVLQLLSPRTRQGKKQAAAAGLEGGARRTLARLQRCLVRKWRAGAQWHAGLCRPPRMRLRARRDAP